MVDGVLTFLASGKRRASLFPESGKELSGRQVAGHRLEGGAHCRLGIGAPAGRDRKWSSAQMPVEGSADQKRIGASFAGRRLASACSKEIAKQPLFSRVVPHALQFRAHSQDASHQPRDGGRHNRQALAGCSHRGHDRHGREIKPMPYLKIILLVKAFKSTYLYILPRTN